MEASVKAPLSIWFYKVLEAMPKTIMFVRARKRKMEAVMGFMAA
jgi:hypothetical protein